MQPERTEEFGLHDLGSHAAPDAGGIVEDHVPGYGADVLEHPAQSVADAFCGLTRVSLHESHVREREGDHEEVQDLPDPGDDRFGLPEVDLHRARGQSSSVKPSPRSGSWPPTSSRSVASRNMFR